MNDYFKLTLHYRKTYWKFYTSIPIEIYRWLKYFVQRGSRGYADCDVWSVDYYLSIIIPSMVRNLRQNIHGTPIIGDNGEALTLEQWEDILTKIEKGFESWITLSNSDNWPLNDDYEINFGKGQYKGPWTEEQIKSFREKDSQDEKCFEEGFALFKEYFGNLWD